MKCRNIISPLISSTVFNGDFRIREIFRIMHKKNNKSLDARDLNCVKAGIGIL